MKIFWFCCKNKFLLSLAFTLPDSAIQLACVAGGSGCARGNFCGQAANSLSGYAREGIFEGIFASVAGGSGCARGNFCGREGIFASGEAASEIPACLISYPFWMPPTFIAFDDEIKLTNHRKGNIIQTDRLLSVARAGISPGNITKLSQSNT